jgi:hypothetical protein
MEMSPSLEAASCAATEESPNILCKPKVHYLIHKSPYPENSSWTKFNLGGLG